MTAAMTQIRIKTTTETVTPATTAPLELLLLSLFLSKSPSAFVLEDGVEASVVIELGFLVSVVTNGGEVDMYAFPCCKEKIQRENGNE